MCGMSKVESGIWWISFTVVTNLALFGEWRRDGICPDSPGGRRTYTLAQKTLQ